MRYLVIWERVGDSDYPDLLMCAGLDARTLVARLVKAVRNNPKGIVIHEIRGER